MCVSPLKGFQIGVNPSGKPDYKITSYKVHHIEKMRGVWTNVFDSFVSPTAERVVRTCIDVPCGNCIECRLSYSRQWSDRMMLEAKNYEYNYFLTLTYDEKHLPFTNEGLMTLRSKDFQDFMKRLRWKYGEGIRFYACGEYGDRSYRPHYHAIVFNIDIPDLVYYKKSRNGDILYNSPSLDSLWKQGYVVVASVSWKSCAYVARYVMKKQKGKTKDYYEKVGVEPEFVRMSRRPGIGKAYFDENYKHIYDCDELIISDDSGGHRTKPPRYFDKQLENINKTLYDFIKDSRKRAFENAKKLMLLQTKLTYEEILKNRGRNIEQKTLALRRIL